MNATDVKEFLIQQANFSNKEVFGQPPLNFLCFMHT